MTTPVSWLSGFKGKFKIPNDNDKILRIILKNPNFGKSKKGKRDIRLYKDGVCINHNTDEIIHSPNFKVEFVGDEDTPNDDEIIKSFHNDNVEFI